MRPILNIIKHLNSSQLREIHKLIHQFARSVERLAVDTQKQEEADKPKEHAQLRKYEKIMLRKLKLQRAIMTRYQAGYTLDHIGAVLDYHPKTIARFIRQYQTDLTILKEIDTDLKKRKVILIGEMLQQGMTKPQIVRKLHVSAYMVTAVLNAA